MDSSLDPASVVTPSLFFIQIAILLLPGVIWARLDDNYGAREERTQFEFAVRSVLFGLVAHAFTYLAFVAFHFPYEVIDLARASQNNVLTRALVIQTLAATGIGFGSAIVWLYAVNYKWLTRFLQTIGATKRYGDEDVWEFTLNSSAAEVQFAHIRDFSNRVVYAGWITVFSETEKLRELVMSKVDIYDFDGNLISSPPSVYIARDPHGIHIEFPIQPAVLETTDNVLTTLTPEELREPWLRYGDRGPLKKGRD